MAFRLNLSPNIHTHTHTHTLTLPHPPQSPFPSTTSTTSDLSHANPPHTLLLSLPACPPRLPPQLPFRAGRLQSRAQCPSPPRPIPRPTPARRQNAHANMPNNPLPRLKDIPNAAPKLPSSAPPIVFSATTPSPRLSARVVWERSSWLIITLQARRCVLPLFFLSALLHSRNVFSFLLALSLGFKHMSSRSFLSSPNCPSWPMLFSQSDGVIHRSDCLSAISLVFSSGP